MKSISPEEKLKSLAGKSIVLLGIGHPLRGDDAAGIELARRLKEGGSGSVIEAGSSPENYLRGAISLRPEIILIADAALLQQQPGAWRLLKRDEISSGSVSTHDTSLGTLMEFIEKESGAEAYLLGIQPKNRGWGSSLSEEVKKTLSRLEGILLSLLPGPA